MFVALKSCGTIVGSIYLKSSLNWPLCRVGLHKDLNDLAACSPGVTVDGHSRLLIQMILSFLAMTNVACFCNKWSSSNNIYIYPYICFIYICGYTCITVLLSVLFTSCATFEYHALALVVAQHGPKTWRFFFFNLVCPCHAAKKIQNFKKIKRSSKIRWVIVSIGLRIVSLQNC